ncbi:MAG: hypothetical protein M3Z96_03140, partial [Pseudomonadota bacterium]|nr:hypothetical protein [Pseudomonadota bacterium]
VSIKTLRPQEGSHAPAAHHALRTEINDARLATCDYAMYDWRAKSDKTPLQPRDQSSARC